MTSSQQVADHRPAATAVLAASIFVAGVVLGAAVGTTVAPIQAPAAVSLQALDPDAPGFRLRRDGEINAGADSAEGVLPTKPYDVIRADWK